MNDHEILMTGKGALPFRFDPPKKPEVSLDIPQVLHMVWINGRIPPKYQANVDAFREHNPDWEVYLWGDENVGRLPMANRDLLAQETNVAAKVDLIRYEIVYQHGGVYLDADTLSLGPGSLARMTQAFLTVSGPPWYNTGNAQFGFARRSNFLWYVIENLRDSRVRALHDIPSRTGPTFLTTCALSFGDMRIVHTHGSEILRLVNHLGDKNW